MGDVARLAWQYRRTMRATSFVPTLTASAVHLLARRTPYLETELHTLGELVGPGSVCIDVGSAAGLYTLALSQLVGADGQVHSVEPLSFAHPGWSRVLGARRGRNVRHHSVALGAEPGKEMMSVPIGRHGPVTGRSFLAWKTDGLGSNAEFADQMDVLVEVSTLDGLCADVGMTRLDFVKIDVEGAELHVLQGGEHAIKTLRPTMLIEIEERHTARYQHSAHDVVTWLTQRGYTMHAWERGWQPASGVCAHARNYLFRPPTEA
jgi:FkbM family methyltransferase